jgi:hypothetical protein
MSAGFPAFDSFATVRAVSAVFGSSAIVWTASVALPKISPLPIAKVNAIAPMIAPVFFIPESLLFMFGSLLTEFYCSRVNNHIITPGCFRVSNKLSSSCNINPQFNILPWSGLINTVFRCPLKDFERNLN